MYKIREDVEIKINQKQACEFIGLAEPTLSNILNRKVACRKVVAYCIAKYIDPDAEIENYFEKIEKGE